MSTLLLSGILSLLATASVGERIVQDFTFTSPFNNRKLHYQLNLKLNYYYNSPP